VRTEREAEGKKKKRGGGADDVRAYGGAATLQLVHHQPPFKQ